MRAKSVKLKLVSNEYVDDKEKIEYYKNEIRRLKEELRNKTSQDISIRSEGYGNINNNFGGGGYIKEDLKEIMNSYKQMNTELNNYKELYLKEKQKSNLYKEKYESLIKNPEESDRINNINNNNQINDDNMYIDEIISQIQSNDESNQILQNSINSVKYSRWKDDTLKISQNYKNDLSSLKEAYKQKIMLLHESVFSNNNTNINNNDDNTNNTNINFLNNNTEIIKDKEENNINNNINFKNDSLLNSAEINIKSKVPEDLLKISQNHSKILPNLSDTNTIEDTNEEDEIINKINNGEIFNNINLIYEISDGENVNNIENIKKIYSDKIEELEKAMEHWKNYIEAYYRNKIKKLNEGGGLEIMGLIDGELPIKKYTTQHQNMLKKLRELYENKVKDIEQSFFDILKVITAKKLTVMNK